MVSFIVEGQPQRKQRPRFRRFGKGVMTYTPKETLNYEEKIRKAYQEQVKDTVFSDVPLHVSIAAYFEIPKSFSKRKRQYAIEHIIKPHNAIDVDNVAKVVLDALNGTAYTDDHYITDLVIRKRYSDQPRIEVEIWEVKE